MDISTYSMRSQGLFQAEAEQGKDLPEEEAPRRCAEALLDSKGRFSLLSCQALAMAPALPPGFLLPLHSKQQRS